MFAIDNKDGTFTKLTRSFKVGDITYPANYPELATDNERSQLSIKELIINQPTLTEYQKLGAQTINFTDTQIIVSYKVENFTAEEIMQKNSEVASNAIQNMLDEKARLYRYDDITSVRSYAGYENQFQAEAIKLAQWSADCWATAGQIEQDVINGIRTAPTLEELLLEMPTLEL